MIEETTNSNKDAEGSSPESIQIPKERLDQEIAKRHDADARLQAALKEVETLKNKQAAPPPQTPAPQQIEMEAIRKKLADIEAINQRKELEVQLKITDQKQLAAVQKVMKMAPDLLPEAALAAARVSDAEVFTAGQNRGFDPSQHSSVRPSGVGAPARQTVRERLQDVKKLDIGARRDAAQELSGRLLAKTLGWARPD